MKHTSFFLVVVATLILQFPLSINAIKWINPMNAGFPVIQNQAFTKETSQTYHRLPLRAKDIVRKPVWDLSQHSAGLAIHFYTNSPSIKVRYKLTGGLSMPHMPSTGVSGVDLYQVDSDGNKHFCISSYAFKDTVLYTYNDLNSSSYHKLGSEYHLYLPLYNGVSWMEIGIDDNSNLRFIPIHKEKPIVLYGTSIAQGACASRPGMAWSNIVERSLDIPLINLGFSGNGKLEKEVLDYINEIEAQIYILDCIPNLTEQPKEVVKDKVYKAVKQIRAKHPTTPIILIEHAGYSNGESNKVSKESYSSANKGSALGYEALKKEKIPNLYYISNKDLDLHSDSWVDIVHPSDFGMVRQAEVIEKYIREILNMPEGNISTTKPVTQRREPNMYEWKERHELNLLKIKQNPPKNIIIGNSITHYWGGVLEAPRQNGKENWNRNMTSFLNLGCGWDRIENVLWRITHGELDGYNANQIVLMIGTNNLDINTDEEIVKGLDLLVQVIRKKQPKAKLQIIGILPRRNKEERIKRINMSIKQMAKENNCCYADAGVSLLQSDGKIDESLFIDGLHPNEKGYDKIVPFIHK